MLLQKIKHFFGFFNLTTFEKDLIQTLRKELPPGLVGVLDSQLSRFNQVDRVLSPDKELPFGHTSFYWVKFGKARFDFPEKFPSEVESEVLATAEVYSPKNNNLIEVDFVLVHGFLFTMKYRSINKIFTPESSYIIRNFQFQGKWPERNIWGQNI